MRNAPVAEPYVLRAGEDRGATGFKIRTSDSAGAVNLLEFEVAPWASGPVLHRHDGSDESFYCLEGRLEMQVGEDRVQLGPGDFAWVPRGTAHTFANAGGVIARALTVAAPGGLDEFFAEEAAYLASLTGPPDPEALRAIRGRHGGSTVGPPIVATAPPDDLGRDGPGRQADVPRAYADDAE